MSYDTNLPPIDNLPVSEQEIPTPPKPPPLPNLKPLDTTVKEVSHQKLNPPSEGDNKISDSVKADRLPKVATTPSQMQMIASSKKTEAQGIKWVPSNSSGIGQEKMKRDLAHSATLMQKIASNQKDPFKLQVLSGSQNPVGVVEEEFFVPRSSLKSEVETMSREVFSETIREMAKQHFTLFKKADSAIQKEIISLLNPLLEIVTKARSPVDGLKKILSALEEKKEMYGYTGKNTEHLEKIKALYSKLGTPIQVPPEIIKYRKDDLINNLSIALQQTQDEGQQATLIAKMKELQKMPGDFMASNDKTLTRNAEGFVSSLEVMAANRHEAAVMESLKKASGFIFLDKAGFAFKQGPENGREELVGEMNKSCSFNPYLIAKEETTLEGVKLGSAINPSGIASKLSRGTYVNGKLWQSYMDIKKSVALKEFKGLDASQEKEQLNKIKEELLAMDDGPREKLLLLKKQITNDELKGIDVTAKKEEFGKLEKQIQEQGPPRGVMQQGLMNLRMQSYDSHAGQFVFVNGEAFCFDEARFLAPNLAFTRKISSAEGQKTETFAAFRGAFLDHPVNEERIPDDLQHEITNRNLDHVQEQLKKLMGSPEFFNEKKELLDRNAKNLDQTTLGTDKEIENLMEEYKVSSSKEPEKDIALLKEKIKEEREEIKKECYQKIHPTAFHNFLDRLKREQEYIRQTENPTIKGMRNFIYPELAPFFKVLERMQSNPSDMIGFAVKNERFAQRSLESIIEESSQQGLASDTELQEMKEALKIIQEEKSCDASLLKLTMDL